MFAKTQYLSGPCRCFCHVLGGSGRGDRWSSTFASRRRRRATKWFLPRARDIVWAPGYWDWRGHRHVWVTGHWERARHGYVTTVAPQWEHEGDRWVLQRGGWHARRP